MPTIPYTLADGSPVKGVTTIIGANLGWNKEALKYWAWKEGKEGRDIRKTTKTAADAGTLAHYLIECDIKDTPPDLAKEFPGMEISEEVMAKGEKSFKNFLHWKKQHRMKVVRTEVHLVSEIFRYGLTPDCLASVHDGERDELCLFDWKTGSGIYADMLIQLAAYRRGWEENFPDMPITGGYHLLRIDKESGSWAHHWWGPEDLDPAWEAFLMLLELDARKKKIEGLA